MGSLLAVDPGGVHVGVSSWLSTKRGWFCVASDEWSPETYADQLLEWFPPGHGGSWAAVAYETFRLRGGTGALQQTGSTFPEVELIGLTRHLVRWSGSSPRLIPVEPSARAAALKRADALGYDWRARGHGGHAKDAEATAIAALGLRAEDIRAATPREPGT